jgi:nitrate reductase NapAB chaperone NapD
VHGNYCYRFVTNYERDFNAAEQDCRSQGGHLVVVRNAGTQDFLYNTFHQVDEVIHYHYGTLYIRLKATHIQLRSQGGHLVVVRDAGTQDFLYMYNTFHQVSEVIQYHYGTL